MLSLSQQVRAVFWRNRTLAFKDKGQLFGDAGVPLLYVVLIFGLGYGLNIKTTYQPNVFPSGPVKINSGIQNHNVIGYSPNNAETTNLMESVLSQLSTQQYPIQTRGFNSDNDMQSYFFDSPATFWAGVSFDLSNADVYKYTIRHPLNSTLGAPNIPITQFFANRADCRPFSPCVSNLYNSTGLLGLISALDYAIISRTANVTDSIKDRVIMPPTNRITLQPLPIEGITTSEASIALQFIIPIYVAVGFSFHINAILVGLVTEKEKRLREGLLMQGLRNEALWLGWIAWFSIYVLITVIPMTLALRFSVYPQSDIIGLFILLLIYGFSNIAFGTLMSTMFKKAKVAAAIGPTIPILAGIIYIPLHLVSVPVELKYVLSFLLYPVGVTFAIVNELTPLKNGLGAPLGRGLSLSGYFAPEGQGIYLIAVITTFVWQGLLTLYIQQVFPGEFGTPRPWHFPITDLIKAPSRGKKLVHDEENGAVDGASADERLIGPNIEADPVGLKRVAEIRELTKIFETGRNKSPLVAVDKLSLNLYEGEIFALLGQNGAGKSTTINMLTGLYPPTSCASATMYGFDLRTEMSKIRQMMGVVPQQNILWDKLNSDEHIRLIVKIKVGGTQAEEDRLVNDALEKVGLTEHRATKAKSLSGGQKRKLAFAMAIVSNPKILILDEPSSALDPESRRDMWRLLTANAASRLCIITTHFMDEADFVAHRKAVIGKGKLQCMGTSLFLKSHFKIGYQLDVAITPKSADEEDTTITKIGDTIQKHVTDAKQIVKTVSNPGARGKSTAIDVKWSLPLAQTEKFADLFNALDKITGPGKPISSFGVTMPTMEEVFLKQTELEATEAETQIRHMPAPLPPAELRQAPSAQSQLTTMFKMRVLALYRQPRFLGLSVLLPAMLFTLSIGMNRLSSTQTAASGKGASLTISNPVFDFTATSNIYFAPAQNTSIYVQASGNNTDFTSTLSSSASRIFINPATKLTSEALDVNWFVKTAPKFGGGKLYPNASASGSRSALDLETVVFYNTSQIHSPAILLTTFDNIMLRGLFATYSSNSKLPLIQAGLQQWTHPSAGVGSAGVNSLSFVAVFIIGYAVMIPLIGFASEMIRDRVLKTDEQLTIMGLSRTAYWGSAWLGHFVLSFATTGLLLILVAAFQLEAFTTGPALGVLCIILVVYSGAMQLFFYMSSVFFRKPESLQSVMSLIGLLIMFIPMILIILLDILLPTQTTISLAVHSAFCIIDPLYTLPAALYKMVMVYSFYSLGLPVPPSKIPQQLGLENFFYFNNGVLIAIIGMIFHGLVCGALLFFGIENWNKGTKKWERIQVEKLISDDGLEEDEDVVAEKARTLADTTRNFEGPGIHDLKIQNVKKVFRTKNPEAGKDIEDENENQQQSKFSFTRKQLPKEPKFKFSAAVKGATFGVKRGTMFSLLGPNGAGKSTLLNMAIGTVSASSGTVTVRTEDNEFPASSLEAHKYTGYCPQHDALWPRLTVHEHMTLFAEIKFGKSQPELVKRWVDTSIEVTGLAQYRDVWAEKLSGGNKRKLSFAISTIGEPTLWFVDEPTTGVDPASRRTLWNLIQSAQPRRTTILTTHAMEEADTLSSQIAIMVNGRIKCIGTSQHLKSRFGLGYLLEILGDPTLPESKTQEINEFVSGIFPNSEERDSFQHIHRFEVPLDDVAKLSGGGSGDCAMGVVFKMLEEAKQKGVGGMQEYAFGQTSLEQVFLRIAKEQKDSEEK